MRIISLLVFISCLLLPTARAQEADDAYQLYFSDIGKKMPVGVMPKAECIATLQTAFNPEETIIAGVNALEAAKNHTPVQACLTELVDSLTTDSPYTPSDSALMADPSKYAAYSVELGQKASCYNPYKEGSYSYSDFQSYHKSCAGKWTTEAEGKKAEAEKIELTRFKALLREARDAMVEENSELQQEIGKLDSKIDNCGPIPYPKDSYYYKDYVKDQKKNCKQTFSEAEIKAMKKKLAELSEKNEKASAEKSKLKTKLQEALFSGSYPADTIFDRRKELIPLARAVVCISPYESGSSDDKYWKSDRKDEGFCTDGYGKKSDLPKARAKFLSALGDLDKLIAKNKEAREEAVKQQTLKLLAMSASKNLRYVQRRLFANYKGYLDRNASGSIDEFCAINEAENRRDAKFSRMNMPGEGPISMYAFKDNKAWLHAQYGLTEAEYKALSMYVGSFYRRINEPLWKHETLSAELSLYKEVLDSALKKLPIVAGGVPLKRHLTLPQESIDAHKPNEIITYDSYTSTSKAPYWSWGGNAKMIIYGGKNSKDVSKFNEGEQEVIFLPGTRFKVIGKETNNGTTNFVLGEVDDHGELVARLPTPKDWTP